MLALRTTLQWLMLVAVEHTDITPWSMMVNDEHLAAGSWQRLIINEASGCFMVLDRGHYANNHKP